MNRIVIAFALVASSRSTVAAPARHLTAKYTEGGTLHIANELGAENWSAGIDFAVDLAPAGTVRVIVVGNRSRSNLTSSAVTSSTSDDITAWKTSWAGTWKANADDLVLDLKLVSDRCKHRHEFSDRAPEPDKCLPVAKHTIVTCTSTQLELADRSVPSKHEHVDAWMCDPAGADDLGESGSPWVLGKTTCVESTGGLLSHFERTRCQP